MVQGTTPPGKSEVTVKGKYTPDAMQTVTKIESSFYTTAANGNLVFKGSVTDPNFANGRYTTSPFVAAVGTAYTVITRMYVQGQQAAVAQTITSITP
ncbi:MAG: hypothetical protein K2X82_23705 [Gemmataceae bacterium]|nr:hypothetical protein [Gemmataceae bacterium]